ncbi:hypothetical protein PSH76_27870 [Pseudomonas sp. FP215]|jgi:hypothetical protein|uniref:hypothetical protein n=1 Tax=Pseudomonas sp. FP215 TaxID=2738126 RepID=UPI002733750B|nr:hypothetical protein [Pseudomonas sp. FP215]WLH23778.1 hypothetical protein PSH76_27870 [Pseudomonas sp. FP215]
MDKTLIVGLMAACLLAGNAYAADIDKCPKVKNIESTPTKQEYFVGKEKKFEDGFKYTSSNTEGSWTGETAGTTDDYLADKYELAPESYEVVNGVTRCNYGGKTIVENGQTAVPNLRLNLQK